MLSLIERPLVPSLPRWLAATGYAVLISACAAGGEPMGEDPAGEPGDEPADTAAEIDSYIRDLGTLPVDEPKKVEGEPGEFVREGDYSCTTQELSQTRQYDRIVAYSANSESLWPGALLRGDSVYTGAFTQVVTDRAPLTISVSLENLAGARSATLDGPSLSSFREAIGDILSAEVTGATPANISSEIEQVHSEQQLTLALGAGVSIIGAPVQISTSFDFDDQEKRSRYVVKYTQAYYTVDVDQPASPSAMFGDGVTLEDLSEHFGPENPPVYVSSITYGRMIVFTFESSYSGQELGSALEFVYKGVADVDGRVSATSEEIVSRSKVTAYILGGSGEDAVQSIDSYEALIEFIKSGGNYSRESPGAPIAYKLAYLGDNAPARLSFSEEYQLKECVRVSQKVKVTLDSITAESMGDDGDDGSLSLFGSIVAHTVDAESGEITDEVVLLEREPGEDLGATLGEPVPLATEAVLEVTPQPGHAIGFEIDLTENDTFADDALPVETFVADFETGWRRTKDILVIANDTRVKVTLSLEPI